MNKIIQIKIFNDVLDQFYEFLETNFRIFKSDVVLARSTTEFVRRSNPRLVVETFMTCIASYKKQIMDCDESFFLNFESNLSSKDLTTENLLTGLKIKKMWLSSDITDMHKARIWWYFHKLLQAGQKVID